MQILSKKRFQFGSGSTRFVTEGGMVIETAPDWITKDPLYALAEADGDITVIQPAASAAGSSGKDEGIKKDSSSAEDKAQTETVKSDTAEKGVSRKGN